MSTLGNKLKLAREDAKLSQLQVGVALEVSDKTISGYEADRITPPVNKLLKIADLLKKPVSFFLGTDVKEYKISSRLRAIEIALRDIRQELREIKLLAQKSDLDDK
jgi:transcriptional regulator with XRE-family HTH domain